MASDEISASPPLSSSRTMAETIVSTRSGSTGRLRKLICSERTSLSRSNGTRRPLRLITVSSRSCTRSKVVKRKLHATHTRRRRITAESSVGRESFTWVSRLLQLGQRIDSALLVNREAVGQRLDTFLDRGLHHRRLAVRRLRDGIEHFRNKPADLLEFGNPEAARGRRRRSQPKARSDERRFRIEGNAVLVAGDRRAHQCLFRDVALQPL